MTEQSRGRWLDLDFGPPDAQSVDRAVVDAAEGVRSLADEVEAFSTRARGVVESARAEAVPNSPPADGGAVDRWGFEVNAGIGSTIPADPSASTPGLDFWLG